MKSGTYFYEEMSMRARTIVTTVIMLVACGLVQGQEADLHGTAELTYMTSYIWRGFDYFADDHAAARAAVGLDLYGTGFGLDVGFIRRAVEGGFVNAETLSVGLNYSGSKYEGESYATNYKVGWNYYGYPDEPRSGSPSGQAADMQDMYVHVFWPEICPVGWVPSYTILMMWPSEGESQVRGNQGWVHIFGVGYDWDVPGLLPDTPEQTLHVSAAAVYNDGAGPGVLAGTGLTGTTDHDWSHAVFGVSTDFDCGNNLTFTPAVYYQSSWEDTVNSEDEYWASLSLKYAF
jgi:hypothetical protein